MTDEPYGSMEIVTPTQILVEGKDDRNFFDEFIKHAFGEETRSNIQIHSYGGNTELEEYLVSLDMAQGPIKIESVGIVRNAEEGETSAFESLQDALKSAGYNWRIPDQVNVRAQGSPSKPAKPAWRPNEPETPYEPETPSVTTLILPGGGQPGALETLLCNTLSKELTESIDEYLVYAQICADSAPLQSKAKRDKARARVYLAAQERQYLSVGVAAHRTYWDFEHPAFGIVREFLEIVSGASGFPLSRE